MKRMVLFTGVLLVLAACMTKPPTTTELLLGTWNCESHPTFGTIAGTTTYSPDGKGIGHLTVVGSGSGMAVEAAGDVTASWKLLEDDTKLQQTIDNLTVTSAKLNGNVVQPKMAQAMLAPFIGGQNTTSAIKIDPKAKTMTLTAADGSVTNCKR